jgi:sarcosine oxidase/L-pipecolate oxidase
VSSEGRLHLLSYATCRLTLPSRGSYQDLALRCLPLWRSWTQSLHASDPTLLPPGLSPTDEILSESGFMRVGQGKSMSPFHQSCLDAVEADGRRERVFVLVSTSGAEDSL